MFWVRGLHPSVLAPLSGVQRRRLIPAPLPDTAALGRKPSLPGQWVDLPPLAGSLKEPFEIKVYEIDDVERVQRHRPAPQDHPTQVRATGARGARGWLGARVGRRLNSSPPAPSSPRTQRR